MSEKAKQLAAGKHGTGREAEHSQHGPGDLAKELRDALARGPAIDYEQLRADLDAHIDPGPRDWYEWAARADRYVCLGGLEEV